MRKAIVLLICFAFLVNSCGTYTGAGAYTGSTLGSILGSAIGGLSDGRRGSNIGTIIGMAGGAVVGSAIGAAADQKDRNEVREHYERVKERRTINGQGDSRLDSPRQSFEERSRLESGFDETNSGDDRIYDFTSSDYTGNYSADEPTVKMPGSSSVESLATGYTYDPTIEVRNARFVDDDEDNVISPNEISKVIFEVINHGQNTVYDVQPTVIETTGNKNIFISPNMHVEKIEPGMGIRYTALVKAGKKLKDGKVQICISVLQGNRAISKVSEFNIRTVKKKKS
jgi:hypothetical protein